MTNTELFSKIKAEIDKRYAEYREKMKTDDFTYYEGMADALDLFEQFIDTLESEKTISPWKRIHTYTEEIHEGDMEKMLLELSVGKGEKRTKIALPDRIVDNLESEKPMNQDELEEEIHKYNKERFDEYFPEQDGDFISEVDFMTCLGRVARHFAQWGAEQILREVEQWVEKNTCRYIDTQNDGEGYITDVFLENSFVDDLEERMKEILAQWGAEHLKK